MSKHSDGPTVSSAGKPCLHGKFLSVQKIHTGQLADHHQKKISLKKDPSEDSPETPDYQAHTFNYVRAMDELVKQKAEEIFNVVGIDTWKPPVLDIGGGAGSLSRLFLGKSTDQYKEK